MNPQMRETGGTWIAYGRGEADFEVTDPQGEVMVPENGETDRDNQYVLKRLDFDEGVYDSFYWGYANRILWPICHSFPTRADLENEDSYWEEGYLPANRKYARAVVETYEPGDRIWIHDYHLALVPQLSGRTSGGRGGGLLAYSLAPLGELPEDSPRQGTDRGPLCCRSIGVTRLGLRGELLSVRREIGRESGQT